MELKMEITPSLTPLCNEGERVDLEVTTIKSTTKYSGDEL